MSPMVTKPVRGAIGPVPKEQTEAVWQRFRGACDKFFARRQEQFAKGDEERREKKCLNRFTTKEPKAHQS